MKTASATYKILRAVDTSYYEWRVLQGVNIYELNRLKSINITFSLTSKSGIDIGNANAAECRMTLLEESANWQRMAMFTVQFRICSAGGGTKSEWLTLGKFYTDERSEDQQGNLSIIAFDAMLKLEQTWSDKIPEALLPASYPITAKAWATMIQSAGLATFADLTQLDDTVAFVGLNTTSTIRDVLKSIAAVHGGNWTVLTNENLKLIQYENVFDGTKTVSGSLIHIDDALAEPVKKLSVNIDPVKVVGKNLFNKNNFVRNVGYIDPNNNRYVEGDGRVTAVLPDPIPVGTYTISRATSARLRVGLVTSTTLTNYQEVTNKVSGTNNSNAPVTITVNQSGYYLAIFFKDTADADEQALLDRLQVEVGSYATSYEDYTCSFTGYTGVEVYHSDADTSNPTTVPITFQSTAGTVYDGTLDVTKGVLKSYPYYDSYDGETLTGHWISSMDEYAIDTTPTIGAHVINDGAIPTTYQLTPTQITLLLGENNLWANTGDVEVTYKSQESYTPTNLTDLGQAVVNLEASPTIPAVTGVHLETEMGTVMESGDSSGYMVKGMCDVSSTTGVPELCLGRLVDYVFKPFEAGTAYLDPRADIGDSVKIDGTIYQIMSIDWTLGKTPTADVSAPYDQEIDHEYTIPNQDTKTYRKAMSLVEEKMDDYVPWDEFATAIEQNEQAVVIAASHTYVTQTVYDAQIAEIQSQIDGSIQSWSGNAVPTLSNAPAEDWTTPTQRAEHVGDTYFVNSDAGIPEAGQYYRFEVNNGVYSWQLLTDSALTEALAQAAAALAAAEDAQDTASASLTEAQSKGKIFVVQPTPPYDVGDLWFNDTNSVIKVCMTARASGNYVASDWVKRDKYIDEIDLETYLADSELIQSLQNQLDQKAETYYQSADPSIDWGIHPVGIAIAGLDVVGISGTIATQHTGDLWYRTTDNTTWYFNGNTWERQDVPADVFDKIDGKAQVFINEPYAPYFVGDLWFNSDTSDIKTCIRQRTTTGFAESDWAKRNKYTDDTATNQLREDVTAEFEVQSSAISAKVSRTGGNNSSFGWVLNDTSHTWYSDNQAVMSISHQNGLVVKGNITATSGFIGNSSSGFEITATAIRNGMTALNDTVHNGIYVGTDGIALGKGNFKVTSSGDITAKSGTIGGFTITATSLYNGMTSFNDTTHNGVYIGTDGIALGKGNFQVTANGDLYANNGYFLGLVQASSIRSDYTDPYSGFGTFNGGGLTEYSVSGGVGGKIGYTNNGGLIGANMEYSTISDAYTDSGINTSLGYANYAAGVFNATNTATYVKCQYLVDSSGYHFGPVNVTINGTTYRIFAWVGGSNS